MLLSSSAAALCHNPELRRASSVNFWVERAPRGAKSPRTGLWIVAVPDLRNSNEPQLSRDAGARPRRAGAAGASVDRERRDRGDARGPAGG
ncbi:hypothetical protein ACFPRL_04225 [Pseudoclavibacter helvolus]